ncbi:MFS family permease [Geosmithia morbida]|uniref:MFS family permease n=1 Tax=Geosmithia morbida TaxID=1094350 RepID=A0A9P5D5H4_9HYPO|nr:MFS family permease [Geosmithia morbida]KAF4124546.1 MFS family permease [Geosmithia morbida]
MDRALTAATSSAGPNAVAVENGERQPLLGSKLTAQQRDREIVPRGEDEEEGAEDRQHVEGGEEEWKLPRHFVWIQFGIMSNVFLSGFDGTITASTYAVISSEFGATNTASWLTTSYLVTNTAFQPLYGRVSDIFGRRICFFVATVAFALGCLGCSLSNDIILLYCMRALTGFGGGGLMTMATIINSDMIPFRNRGMYQALQNSTYGLGAICGASLGGSIADSIGWRWCFLLQVPMSAFALFLGYTVIKNPSHSLIGSSNGGQWTWLDAYKKVDISGSLLLVTGISIQLLGLSLGGNELPWSSPWVVGSLVGSVIILVTFLIVEVTTKAVPIIPFRLLRGKVPIATQISNACVGLAVYGYIFMLPLFFQVVLLDSATKAGVRLVIPSIATPIGGVISGVVMSRWGKLPTLVRTGCFLMAVGIGLVASLSFVDSHWKYFTYIFVPNLGQGIVYPGLLFTSLATFEHSEHAATTSTVYLIRSLGTVWGVSVTSAIVQTTLNLRLPDALDGVPDKWKIIDAVRHSVEELRNLPPDVQLKARLVYYDGFRYSFIASSAVASVALVSAFFINGKNLRTTVRK